MDANREKEARRRLPQPARPPRRPRRIRALRTRLSVSFLDASPEMRSSMNGHLFAWRSILVRGFEASALQSLFRRSRIGADWAAFVDRSCPWRNRHNTRAGARGRILRA